MHTIEALRALEPISADSHVVEPPDLFRSHIEAKFKDIAPYGIDDPERGYLYIVEGLSPVGMGGACSAGIPAQDLKLEGRHFSALHRGGWDAKARVADMMNDGLYAEILYPSAGMAICDVADLDYKRASARAYNRWLQEYCGELPGRLFGVGMTAARDGATMAADIREIHELGLKGVMIPAEPGVDDYDAPEYDQAWAAAAELGLPICVHILVKRTKDGNAFNHGKARGGRINGIFNLMRAAQDIVGVLLWGGVFDRHPTLNVVTVEADAGWLPHYIDRSDRNYDRHRYWLGAKELKRQPRDVLSENLYVTFQDDRTAFDVAHLLDDRRLLWASDYPHSDSTWPESMQVLQRTAEGVDEALLKRVVHDNVRELFRLKLS